MTSNLFRAQLAGVPVRGTQPSLANRSRGIIIIPIVLAFMATYAKPQTEKHEYPSMAPIEQYRIATAADEIALARSAAPESVSKDAEVLVLATHGYETAVKGTNGFVCIVERSWATEFDDADFWNPKIRAPICYNAPAAKSVLPPYLKRTEWVLAGLPKATVLENVKSAVASKTFADPDAASMCYMLSSKGYLSDEGGHWLPHLMFFFPHSDTALWGGNLPGSPIIASQGKAESHTVFLIPVSKWSDGSAAPNHP
jgi:hypothetical protein